MNKFCRDKIIYSTKLNTIKWLIKLRFAYLQKYNTNIKYIGIYSINVSSYLMYKLHNILRNAEKSFFVSMAN